MMSIETANMECLKHICEQLKSIADLLEAKQATEKPKEEG